MLTTCLSPMFLIRFVKRNPCMLKIKQLLCSTTFINLSPMVMMPGWRHERCEMGEMMIMGHVEMDTCPALQSQGAPCCSHSWPAQLSHCGVSAVSQLCLSMQTAVAMSILVSEPQAHTRQATLQILSTLSTPSMINEDSIIIEKLVTTDIALEKSWFSKLY